MGRMFKSVVISAVAAATFAAASFSPQSLIVGAARADSGSRATIARTTVAAAPVVRTATVATAAASVPAAKKHGIVVRRVTIPRLLISLPVMQGTASGAARERIAYHFPASGWPGSGRSTYIYGHARTGTFLSLWKARKGDKVYLTLANGHQAVYKVFSIRRVRWYDATWVYKKGEYLALQTCTGRNPKGPRLLVVAVRIS